MNTQERARALIEKLEGYDLIAPELRQGQRDLLENVLIVALGDVRHEVKMIALDAQATAREKLRDAKHYSDMLTRDIKRLEEAVEEAREKK